MRTERKILWWSSRDRDAGERLEIELFEDDDAPMRRSSWRIQEELVEVGK